MRQPIEIAVSVEKSAAREERTTKAKRPEEPHRGPVIPAIAHRFLVPQVGVSFRDYYNDPEIMLRTQILAQKWLMENIRTDAYGIAGAWVGAWSDFQNTFEAGSSVRFISSMQISVSSTPQLSPSEKWNG